MTFTCTTCLAEKPCAEFYEAKRLKRGHYSECKTCWDERSRRWRASNPDKVKEKRKRWVSRNKDVQARLTRRSALARKYGLSEKQYDDLFARQNGRCAICGEAKKLVVDHCHSTGRVRALLCDDCNRGLGCFKDDPVRLQKAAEVLAALMDVDGSH